MKGSLPVWIDTDNALGAPFGDVDDAFAITAVMKAKLRVLGLSSVFGNTNEPLVFRNNERISQLLSFSGPVLHGASTPQSTQNAASTALSSLSEKVRVLAIGPMTNIARALRSGPDVEDRIEEVVFVGTNFNHRLPAMRFFDFNQAKDPKAFREVVQSRLRLTCVPCDVARDLRASLDEISSLPGAIGSHLYHNSRRWYLRASLFKGLGSIPVWDLAAAMYLVEPNLFTVSRTTVSVGRFGQARYGRAGDREVKVVTGFDAHAVWSRFKRIVSTSM